MIVWTAYRLDNQLTAYNLLLFAIKTWVTCFSESFLCILLVITQNDGLY